MKMVKKIIILLLMIVGMLVLGTSRVEALPSNGNSVDLKKLNEGQTWHIGFGEYNKYHNSNLFCAEKGQRQWSEGRQYSVIAHIRIENSTSWRIDKNGSKLKERSTQNQKIDKDYNRKLATGLATLSGEKRKYFIWGYLKTWIKNVGSEYKAIPADFATKWQANNYDNIINEVQGEMDEIEGSLNDFDFVYEKEDINYVDCKIDDKEYTRIGPYQLTGIPSEGLKKFMLYDQNGEKIKGVKCIKYNGEGEKQVFDITEKGKIKNNKNFYICIPKKEAVTEFKAELETNKMKSTDVKADIFLLKCSDWSWQNLAAAEATTTTSTGDTAKIELTGKMPGDLTIYKEGEENKKLSGAKFLIYKYVKDDKGTWYKTADKYKEKEGDYTKEKKYADDKNTMYIREYLSKENTKYYTYVKIGFDKAKKDQNYIFTTDKDGKISLENLQSGTYFASEIEAPTGYLKLDNPVKLGAVKAQEPKEKTIKNMPDDSDLTIIKRNEDGTKSLPGAQFVIYIENAGGEREYLRNDNTYTKTTLENIQNDKSYIYVTGEDGKISFKDLKVGTSYFAIEIKAPEGYKKLDEPIKLGEVKEQEPIKKEINNTPTGDGRKNWSNYT